jgi:sarcosine oxidase
MTGDPTSHRFDVIIVGVGAMGSAACWQLARRGVNVLGIERYDIPHELGSSGGDTRMIRLSYFEHPDYVPLLRRAYAGWDELGAAIGERILERTGALYIGREDGELIGGSRRAALTHSLDHRMLSREQRKRYGAFDIPPHFAAMFESDAGFVRSALAITTMAEQALLSDATLHTRESVVRWSADAHGVEVQTDRAMYRAERLVFTCGAWTAQLVAGLGVPLRVTRQALLWFWPRHPEQFRLGAFPCWALEDDTPGFVGVYYGFPLMNGQLGLKIALHAPGETALPDQVDRDPRDHDVAALAPLLDKYLPGARGPVTRQKICMYTMSPDGHFIVDRLPGHTNVVIAAGFSGHGFKFAPVIGEALADLVQFGRTDLPIGFLGLQRFDAGAAGAIS